MTKTHSMSELNHQSGQLAECAARGETVVITRHRQAYVVILSVAEYERLYDEGFKSVKSTAD